MKKAGERIVGALPIDGLRRDLEAALAVGPVVVSSPTGSGKSTRVPCWCPGRVLVVEPRRVACRALARRVAELEGVELGREVGYHVRDERRAGAQTRLLFVTPGVALRVFEELASFDTLVLDEFHERTLDVDLLLALALERPPRSEGRLVVMSATLEGERVAAHLGGRHLHAEGRAFPVAVSYLPGGALLPDARGLEERLLAGLEEARRHPGDVLAFLPGKGEIAACARAIAASPRHRGAWRVVELHGGLSLDEQSRAFEPAERRKVVLATNVAETSLTLPGIGVVLDSGLVRRTRYHRGRGFLTLVPIAEDSAAQRAGRAGRTAPGVCLRLWSEAARLEPRTPPEVHREALAPLVLAAAACGARAEELPFLDPPPEHALESAREELAYLGALEAGGAISARGRRLFGLPLDAPLGRWLVEAEAAEEDSPGVLADMVDLVSTLTPNRPFWSGGPPRDEGAEAAPAAPEAACDAALRLRALRGDPGPRRRAHPAALAEAEATRRRLRAAFGLSGGTPAAAGIDRRRLALTVLAADPRAAHVARRRGRRVAWSNGGTEIELGRESAAAEVEGLEALVVLETRALGLSGRAGRVTRVIATCAMPVPFDWLLEAGLGRDRVAGVAVEGGRAVARVERVWARRVLETREEVPRGAVARGAVARLFLEGRVFPEARATAAERLAAAALARRLAAAGLLDAGDPEVARLAERYRDAVPELEEWVAARLQELELESGEDLALLTAGDFLPPELPRRLADRLEREFPRALDMPEARYEVDYDLARRRVTLRKVAGSRREPPPLAYLPRFAGFAVRVQHHQTFYTLRER